MVDESFNDKMERLNSSLEGLMKDSNGGVSADEYEDPVEAFKAILKEWGATIRQDLDKRLRTVDFITPFPGDQPISSGAKFEDGKLDEASVRYGVLDEDKFMGDVHRDEHELQRLKRAVRRATPPQGVTVLANFGDERRVARPHVLIGWRPKQATDEMVVQEGDYEPVDAVDAAKFIVRAGRNIRREFSDEFV